ncbi:MAG: glycosyltransferase family 2 protein [bacterium]|nr:glycosyltransferase family 2 protein [bacterium]
MEKISDTLKIFLVVPTYNGQDDMPDFFSSLKESLVGVPYDVTVVAVDNNSHDKTVPLARELFPSLIILQNDVNTGYAGVSRGMLYALEHGADYVGVLNQDLVLSKGWLAPLIIYLQKHGKTGSVQPAILLDDDKSKINSYGNAFHYLGFGYTLGHKQNIADFKPARPLFYCSGACEIFSADALKKVGVLDEFFFLYHEDSDISWRLRLAGYAMGLEPTSVVYHKYVFGKSALKFYYIERNRLLVMLKNYSIRTMILIAPMFIVTEFAMLASSFFGSILRIPMLGFCAKLRTYGFFLRPSTWRHIQTTRKKIHAQRCVSDRDIVKWMVPDVAFQDMTSPIVKYIMNPLTRAYWAIIRPLI